MFVASSSLAVFLDTDLVVNAVVRGLRNTEACRDACQELMNSGGRACYSPILRVEQMQAIRRLATKQQLPNDLFDEFELHRWSEKSVRERWLNSGVGQLHAFLDSFPMSVELPLRDPVFRIGLELMAHHSLGSLDSIQRATALHYEIPVFWTCDDHFQRVDDLFVEIIRDSA